MGKTKTTSEVKFVLSQKNETVAMGVEHLTKTLRANGLKTLLHHSAKRNETAITKQSLYEYFMKENGHAEALANIKEAWEEATISVAELWEQTQAMKEWDEQNPYPEEEDDIEAWTSERETHLKGTRTQAMEDLIEVLPEDDFAWH